MSDFLSNYAEPARLRAILAALVALLGTVGITVNTHWSGLAEALIVLVGVAVPLIQGATTRAAVYSPATFDAATGRHRA